MEDQLLDEKLVVPWDEQFYDASTNSYHYTDEDLKAAGIEQDDNHEHDENGECILGDDTLANRINGFKQSYVKGRAVLEGVNENEDWFLSPDEAGMYSTHYYCGANSHGINYWTSKQGNVSLSWTYNFPNITDYGAIYGWQHRPEYYSAAKAAENALLPSKGGWGQYATIYLDPGEQLRVGLYRQEGNSNTHVDINRSWQTYNGSPITYSGDSITAWQYYYGHLSSKCLGIWRGPTNQLILTAILTGQCEFLGVFVLLMVLELGLIIHILGKLQRGVVLQDLLIIAKFTVGKSELSVMRLKGLLLLTIMTALP
jgi:hypothetical protein